MLELNNDEMVFSFPEVHDRAVLRVHFQCVSAPEQRVPFHPQLHRGGVLLAGWGRVVMHLRPTGLDDARAPAGARYPFAIVVAVNGINAITGEALTSLARSPQNYFASPPQGGIDGYYRDGQVAPFRVGDEAAANRQRLELKVLPMKREAFAFLEQRHRLTPGPGPAMHGSTLTHGGERQCEPIYEDLCCIGDWDQEQAECGLIWVAGEG